MTKFGLKSQLKNTKQWGGPDGISGGNIKYNEIVADSEFKIIDSKLNKKNVVTDKPYDAHIKQ